MCVVCVVGMQSVEWNSKVRNALQAASKKLKSAGLLANAVELEQVLYHVIVVTLANSV